MDDRVIIAGPLTREAFAAFGDVLDKGGAHYPINGGMTERYDDLAPVEIAGPNARVRIAVMTGKPYAFPLALTLVERHPLGSQAFMPLSDRPFLVVVAEDGPDGPGEPRAFVTRAGQGVSYRRNIWHAVLTPIAEVQDFLVVDRGGDGSNLEEHRFAVPWEIHLPGMTV